MLRLPLVTVSLAAVACGGGAGSNAGDGAPGSRDAGSPADARRADLPAPTVQGEASAGHPDPTWLWSTPEGAADFRYRLDGGAWRTVGLETTSFTAAELAEGSYLFEVQAGDGSGGYSKSGTFTTVVEYFGPDGYWRGTARELSTTPEGHPAPVNYHNAYADNPGASPAANLSSTLTILHEAQAQGADLLELDLFPQDGTWYISHDAGDFAAFAARLEDVLADPALKEGDQVLYVEVKPPSLSLAEMKQLFELFAAEGYAINGRPVIVRSFHDRDGGQLALAALENPEFLPLHRHYFRVHALYRDDAADTPGFHDLIAAAAAQGYHGVELQTAGDWTPNMFAFVRHAHALGLGAGQWTVQDDGGLSTFGGGEVWCHAFRNELDSITTDYSPGDCAADVGEASSLLYLNVWDHSPSATAIAYHGEGGAPLSIDVGGAGEPTVEPADPGEDLYGSFLQFDRAADTALVFDDLDNQPADGYFVAVLVNFDEPFSLASSSTYAILNKADSGGFALELLTNVLGDASTLRFGVHVDGEYRYASASTAGWLNGEDSYLIVGAYDGDGRVRLYLDGKRLAQSSSTHTGGVTQNDSPIVLGADPQGASSTRFHFSGKIQMAQVQNWTQHR